MARASESKGHIFSSARVSRARVWVSMFALGFVLWALYLVQTRQVEYFEVTSESMEPTIEVGDTWLMVPTDYYQHNDMVVFLSPDDNETMLVKRIVAMAPDVVELRAGYLYINNRYVPPPQAVRDSAIELPDQRWVLDPDEVFLVGDNRPISHDSREFGPIRLERLRGVLRRRVENVRTDRLLSIFTEIVR